MAIANCLAEYGFNEGTGTTAADTSGNARTLSGVPGWATGHTGQGAQWTGEAYATVPQAGNVDAPWTLMTWVKFDSFADWQAPVKGGGGLWLEVDGAGVLDCYVDPGPVLQGPGLTVGTWHHLAVTCDATGSVLYLDGTSVATSVATATLTSLSLAGDPTYGVLDDFRWFSVALPAADVAAWMNHPADGAAPSAGTPVSIAAPAGVLTADATAPSVATGGTPATIAAPAGLLAITATPPSASGGSVIPASVAAPAGTATISGTAPTISTTAFAYITAIDPSGRYFLDQNANPILLRGDSPWAAFTKISLADWQSYVANRASYGVNTLLVSAVGTTGNGGYADTGATFDGFLPFVAGDITRPNEAYWARVDSFISIAADAGITLMIYPIDGWNINSVFNGKSATDCGTYGTFIGNRYKARPNVIWSYGGDYMAATNDADIPAAPDLQFAACLDAIHAAGDTKPTTIQTIYDRSLSSSFGTIPIVWWQRKVDFNFAYTYLPTYDCVRAGYNQAWNTVTGLPATRPVVFGEGDYDNSPVGAHGVPAVVRRQVGWSMTSGAAGCFTGQEGVWNFLAGWASYLSSAQTTQWSHFLDAFAGLAGWHLLAPDLALITNPGTPYAYSNGDVSSSHSALTSDYRTAASTPDGSLAVLYIPDASTATTVNDSGLGTAARTATWVDPSTGATSAATWGGSYSTGANAAGANDWLLILTAAPVGSPAAVTPPAGNLALSGTGPSITSGSGVSIAGPAGQLGITATTPSVTGGTGVIVTVPPGLATITGTAPQVTIGAGATVAAPSGQAIIDGTAPTVVGGIGAAILAPSGWLAIDATAPVATIGGSASIYPAPGTLTLDGTVPSVAAGIAIAAPAGLMALDATAPGIGVGGGVEVTPTAGLLSLLGTAPDVQAGRGAAIDAAAGLLDLSGAGPGITAGASVSAPAGVLTLAATAPIATGHALGPTPTSRTYAVPADDRTYRVEAT